MGLAIVNLNWLQDQIVVGELNQLLKDLALKFETRQMSAVGQYMESFFCNQSVEAYVEHSAYRWYGANSVIEVPHRLQTDFHNLGFFVFHRKNNCVNDCLEHLALQLKHALGAVVNDVVY